jgi:hypothetical protein
MAGPMVGRLWMHSHAVDRMPDRMLERASNWWESTVEDRGVPADSEV